MKITINSAYDLRTQFENYDRDYYSKAGYEKLLELYDDDYELDVIEICGEWSEYGEDDCTLTIHSLINDYGYLLDCGGYTDSQLDELTDDELEEVVDELVDELENQTEVYRLHNGNIMVRDF